MSALVRFARLSFVILESLFSTLQPLHGSNGDLSADIVSLQLEAKKPSMLTTIRLCMCQSYDPEEQRELGSFEKMCRYTAQVPPS